MTQRGSDTTTIEKPRDVKKPVDLFANIDFKTPLMQLARQYLGPFLAHKETCADPEACTCGLRDAVIEVQRRETLVTRYGTAE